MPQEHLPGDLQLARMGAPGGPVIRWLQRLNGDGFADYEHVRVYLGHGEFAEAQPGGAVIAAHLPLNWDGVYWDSGLWGLTQAQRDGTVMAARGYVQRGVGYSWLDYAALASRRLHIPAPGLEEYIRSTGHMQCAQFASRCRYDGGAPMWDGWTGNNTPGDIWQLCEARRKVLALS
jgi:hypothetical protein